MDQYKQRAIRNAGLEESFIKRMENRPASGLYKYLADFSNRQIKIGTYVQCKIEKTDEFILIKVLNKPYYTDSWGKQVYRGYLEGKSLDGKVYHFELSNILKRNIKNVGAQNN